MTKEEYNTYLKDLDNMNLVTNEIRFRDNEIVKERNAHQRTRLEMGNTIAQRDSTIAQQAKIIEDLQRQIYLKT